MKNEIYRKNITEDKSYICVIGGANIDLQGFPKEKLKAKDSNPGILKTSLGGVGRNIAENLVRLGIPVKLLTAVGNDSYGKSIFKQASEIGLDMSNVLVVENSRTSKYLSILDIDGDMALALNDMEIMKKIDVDFVDSNLEIIKDAAFTVIDTNIEKNIIEYILNRLPHCKFFLDTVSTVKALKVKELIGCFHTIKPNKIEAEIISGIKIECLDDYYKAARYFHERGVAHVFISSSDDGVFYSAEGGERGFIEKRRVNVINSTGAGDAFLAGLAYSHFNLCDIAKSAKNAMAASIITLKHEDTINPNININELNIIKKEYNLC